MLRVNKSWPRVLFSTALACACLCAPAAARAEQTMKLDERLGEDVHLVPDSIPIPVRSPLQKEVPVEPPAALVKFNLPGLAAREPLWAAHASAANEPRFQRAFFLSAHVRF